VTGCNTTSWKVASSPSIEFTAEGLRTHRSWCEWRTQGLFI